jgi:hypothetical protein
MYATVLLCISLLSLCSLRNDPVEYVCPSAACGMVVVVKVVDVSGGGGGGDDGGAGGGGG